MPAPTQDDQMLHLDYCIVGNVFSENITYYRGFAYYRDAGLQVVYKKVTPEYESEWTIWMPNGYPGSDPNPDRFDRDMANPHVFPYKSWYAFRQKVMPQ